MTNSPQAAPTSEGRLVVLEVYNMFYGTVVVGVPHGKLEEGDVVQIVDRRGTPVTTSKIRVTPAGNTTPMPSRSCFAESRRPR